jgi:hypothetical protein
MRGEGLGPKVARFKNISTASQRNPRRSRPTYLSHPSNSGVAHLARRIRRLRGDRSLDRKRPSGAREWCGVGGAGGGEIRALDTYI